MKDFLSLNAKDTTDDAFLKPSTENNTIIFFINVE
jgi:hypothetical protein